MQKPFAAVSLGAVRHNVRALSLRAGVPVIAVVKDDDTMTEITTEDIPIDATNTRGRTLKGVKWKAKAVYAMRYRELEE